MKVKITHEPEEQELAERIFQFVRRLLPRSRVHETEQDGRRILYLTSRKEGATYEEHERTQKL